MFAHTLCGNATLVDSIRPIHGANGQRHLELAERTRSELHAAARAFMFAFPTSRPPQAA
jgi:hypothetical protein